VVTFEELQNKTEATGLKANTGKTEAAVERYELYERLVVRRRRWLKKRTPDSVRSQNEMSDR
jgi:hypothetical protein